MPRKYITAEVLADMKELRMNGWTDVEIGAHMGFHTNSVWRALRRAPRPGKPQKPAEKKRRCAEGHAYLGAYCYECWLRKTKYRGQLAIDRLPPIPRGASC